jgi:hypothetical protein
MKMTACIEYDAIQIVCRDEDDLNLSLPELTKFVDGFAHSPNVYNIGSKGRDWVMVERKGSCGAMESVIFAAWLTDIGFHRHGFIFPRVIRFERKGLCGTCQQTLEDISFESDDSTCIASEDEKVFDSDDETYLETDDDTASERGVDERQWDEDIEG